MSVPHTILKNVLQAYRCSEQSMLLPRERGRSIRAENSKWDVSLLPELRILALRVLAEGWEDTSIFEQLVTCVDKNALLEILPNDLPFDLIVERIPYEYYWNRAATQRWQYNIPGDHDHSWRNLFCERHLAEYLENLEPDHFETLREECEALVKRVQPYVRTLKIRCLRPSKSSFHWSADEDTAGGPNQVWIEEDLGHQSNGGENSTVHHIPFNTILPYLSELRELYLNFGVIYVNEIYSFEWRDFRFSVEDCIELGQALKNCPRIEKLSLTRSYLDRQRAAPILQGILANNNVKVIDFSHCKLGDNGGHAIGEFLKIYKHLDTLSLVNNGIGASGVAGIVHGLLQDHGSPLKSLNLRLNPLGDDGGVYICALLLRTSSLERLNVSGCGFGAETGIGIAEVISTNNTKFSTMAIDVTNNDLGRLAGRAFAVTMKSRSTVIALDGRMCNFSKESECSISETIAR